MNRGPVLLEKHALHCILTKPCKEYLRSSNAAKTANIELRDYYAANAVLRSDKDGSTGITVPDD